MASATYLLTHEGEPVEKLCSVCDKGVQEDQRVLVLQGTHLSINGGNSEQPYTSLHHGQCQYVCHYMHACTYIHSLSYLWYIQLNPAIYIYIVLSHTLRRKPSNSYTQCVMQLQLKHTNTPNSTSPRIRGRDQPVSNQPLCSPLQSPR